MRSTVAAVLALPLLSLAACGGGTEPQTVGGIAPPVGGGTGGGVGGGTGNGGTPTPTPANFLDVTTETSFDAIGAFQSLNVDQNTNATLYQGNASTVRTPSGTISFSPRDGIFTLTISDTKAGVSRTIRFQDPKQRSDFTQGQLNALEAPGLDDFNYQQVFDGTATPVFFYQRPGTATKYVTLGGYTRVSDQGGVFNAERGVFAFGQKTPTGQVPTSGTGTYTGGMLATMVNDANGGANVLQWINGSSKIDINFGTGKVDLAMTGTVGQGLSGGQPVTTTVPAGYNFNAAGTATVDLVRSGGFAGAFTQGSVGFTAPGGGSTTNVDFRPVSAGGSTAGASSIDGAFYGPNGANVGGNFRIVGGVPNQRVDIQGAFTGARQ